MSYALGESQPFERFAGGGSVTTDWAANNPFRFPTEGEGPTPDQLTRIGGGTGKKLPTWVGPVIAVGAGILLLGTVFGVGRFRRNSVGPVVGGWVPAIPAIIPKNWFRTKTRRRRRSHAR